MDSVTWAALITSLGGLAIALIDNRRMRSEHKASQDTKKDDSTTALRIKEIEAVQEFRDTLRQTVKDQAETIGRLGVELEENRLERLKFERERLDWYEERADLRGRVEALETSLGEARAREEELDSTLRAERESWALQRRGLEGRIHSLERALKAAGVDVPRDREAHG